MFIPTDQPIEWREGKRFSVQVTSPSGDQTASQHKTPEGALRRVGELGSICQIFSVDAEADRELRDAEEAYMEKYLREKSSSTHN